MGALREQMADSLGCIAHSRESDVADLNNAVEALRVGDAIIEASNTKAPVKL
jgi:predicted dehydrogenase